jgi:lipopolysaccharide/colanic/teichoic acid biosynthesis glycosyltransferase
MDVTGPPAHEQGTVNPSGGGGRALTRPHARLGAHGESITEFADSITLSHHAQPALSFQPYPDADDGTIVYASAERANRFVNFCLALAALLILSPLLLLIAIAVKLTSRGPILYTQIRVGVDHRFESRRQHRERRAGIDRRAGLDRRGRIERRTALNRRSRVTYTAYGRRWQDLGGRPFRIYKFRSMCVGAECGSGAVWATKNDARVTSLGRVLRQFRLDEVPQLVNVLKGDMNIVGPRPERPSIFSRLRVEIPEYPLRQRARPGITGWAQIKNNYDTSVDDVRRKVGFDLEYLRRRSVLRDLGIMVRTVPTVLFRRGW